MDKLNKPGTFLTIALLLGVTALAYLIRNHADYGENLPPGLPADIPIVDGTIISGRRTLFEDGRGYVVDIQTELSYAEAVEFYADRVGYDRIRPAPGMGATFSTAAFRLGGKNIRLEIHVRDKKTYVTIAIHLGTWW